MTDIELLQDIMELQKVNNELLAQQNINQLFIIGSVSAILVVYILYKAIKKFI